MKKAMKMLAWTILGIVALVLVLVLAIPLWLGPTVKTAANQVAPEYTGTKFSLGDVKINPYSGKYSLAQLHLANPEGYPVPEAFSFEKVAVDVDMGSLFTDTIVIRDITIDSVYASYVSANGVNNFDWIADHAQKKLGPKKEKEKDEGPGKKVVIEKLTISGTRVKISVMPEMPIPTITLKDIGKDKGGATWEEIGQTILDALMQASSSIGQGLTSAIGLLGKDSDKILGSATNVLSGAKELLGGASTNILGGATKSLEGAQKSIGDMAGKILGGGALDASKSVGNGALNAGKAVGNGALDAGKAVGDGALNVSKAVGGGALDAGKAVGSGALDAGKAIGKGAVETGKAIGDGAKDALKKMGGLFGN